MKLSLPSQHAWIYRAALFLLAAVCGLLAFLQYRWIGEVADAENQRLRQELQRNLNLVRRDFNAELTAAAAAIVPNAAEIEQKGSRQAYLDRYEHAGNATKKFFNRVAIAVPENSATLGKGNRPTGENGEIDLLLLDGKQNHFRKADWPLGWATLREGLSARLAGRPPAPEQYRPEGVIEFPRLAANDTDKNVREHQEPAREQEWLILEFDRDYLRNALLPQLLQRYLGEAGQPQYSVVVSETADAWQELYRWGPRITDPNDRTDAWVTLFELDSNSIPVGVHDGVHDGIHDGIREIDALSAGAAPQLPAPDHPEAAGPSPPGHGTWTIRAKHPAGSVEAIVARARRRNLLLATGLLSLLIATAIALIRFTRGAEKLAQMQMNFVSGISHELRTPLSVIRAAGYNLRTKFADQPQQVERYGILIQDESEKLTTLVEQILRYGNVESERILGPREPLEIQPLLEVSLPAARQSLLEAGISIEEKIAANLPIIKADRQSLTHAFRNLVENAVKHGRNGNNGHTSICIHADHATLRGAPAVRIGLRDNGPGIPKEGREHVFEPFFRGKLATENQVHGTGLGLNLAKRIIEAHGGSLVLHSEVGKGTELLATIPANPNEIEMNVGNTIRDTK